MPDFSVIIPCFNAAGTLGETLEALRAQTHRSWEAICVDDGSRDETREIVRDFARRDPRIFLVCNPGKGPSDARNYAARSLTNGGLIAFCDADDIWVPSKLADLIIAFKDTTVDAVFGRIAFFRACKDDATVLSTVPRTDLSIRMLLGENPVCTMSNVTVRKDVFAASGGFDPTIVHNEDLEWLIRLVGKGARVVGLDRLQTFYRTSAGGLSSDLDAMRAGREHAIATAARYGVKPCGKSHAIHQRYLARRALRLGHGRLAPLRHTLKGLAHSPAGFSLPLRRGGLTLLAALSVTVLPRSAASFLFSR